MTQQERLESLIEQYQQLNEKSKDYVRELIKALAKAHQDWNESLMFPNLK